MSPQEFVLVMLFGFLTWIVMHQGSHGWYYTQDIREGHRRYAGNSSPLLILIMGFEQYIFFLSIILFVYMMVYTLHSSSFVCLSYSGCAL
jgi:hypothetical protein